MASFARLRLSALLPLLGLTLFASAQNNAARFDLTGPKIDVRVTRDGRALPIATVPTLLEGDELWLHADLPATQSVRYLLVAVFLRGTTNPPPENWIVKIDTWDKRVKAEGARVNVPQGAQQALLLLAPETGGDISTLRSAVRARPGVFVRATQDLDEAGFEQARIEKYLAEMRNVPPSDPKALAEHSDLLARTLNLKPNTDCFKRPIDQQYTCLTQSGTQSLLDDGHGQSIVSSLTSGASSDLITNASATTMAGAGVYSAYVGAIVDVVRIMGSLHTAHYTYIPAIGFPEKESLNLRLNTPPSFDNPKSVIVIGLPAIQKATPPPLRAADPKHVTCLLKPEVALPVEGAPLVFSTSFAHDLVLHRKSPANTADLSLTPDAFQGGLVIHAAVNDTRKPLPAGGSPSAPATPAPASAAEPSASAKDPQKPAAKAETTANNKSVIPTQQMASVSGMWGFDQYEGPVLPVQDQPGEDWKLTATKDHIIAGEKNQLTLSSTGTACIESITAQEGGLPEHKLEWKPGDKHDVVTFDLPLSSNNPGAVSVIVRQYGKADSTTLSIQAFSKPAEIKSVEFHIGDSTLTLHGSNLNEVKQFTFSGVTFQQPAGQAPAQNVVATETPASTLNSLQLSKTSGDAKLQPGQQMSGVATLTDGRTITSSFTAQASRPGLTVLSKRVVRTGNTSTIQLLNQDDVPLDAQLMLSLRANAPFPRNAAIEIANEDNSLYDKLTLADGSLVLQDRSTVLAQIDLRKTFGSSAFGPLQIRLILHDGTAGDWMPLATLVRLPTLNGIACLGTGTLNCELTGSNLFLIDSIAADSSFTNPVGVPDGFVGSTLMVPHPTSGPLYLKLRDDPASMSTANPAQAQRPE